MNREAKEKLVASYKSDLAKANLLILTSQSGMTVAEVEALRAAARAEGAKYQVVKNSLIKLAFADTPFAELADSCNGPMAITTSQDPVAAAKVMFEGSKKNTKLIVVSGATASQRFTVGEISALAELPSLPELRATLLRIILAPASRLAMLTSEAAARIPRLLAKRGEQ